MWAATPLRPGREVGSSLIVQLTAVVSGGVQDHANALQRCWRQSGVRCETLAISQATVKARPLLSMLRPLLLQHQGPCTLLLHFSGYGFQARGLCFWLLRELHQVQQTLGPQLQLATLFHELFASGPAWRSAFWLAPAQAWIAKELARCSDQLWTNTEHHARWLRRHARSVTPLTVNPVFSNVGEPDEIRAADAREPVFILFGSQATRQRAWQQMHEHFPKLRELGAQWLLEVGSGSAIGGQGAKQLGLNYEFAGVLCPNTLTQLLLRAKWGLLDYPAQYLGKSSVFAAYAAHGLLALNTAAVGASADGLQEMRHYLSLRSTSFTAPDPMQHQALALAAWQWYAGHRLADQAQQFVRAFKAQPGT